MLNRRELLTTGAGGFVTLLLTRVLPGCGSDSSSNGTTSSTNPTQPTCDGAGEVSSVTLGHTHELCVPASDLGSPPAGGTTYTTSTTQGHFHGVSLTQAQLAVVNQGGTVTITTTVIDKHTHDFQIQKATSQVTVPVPVPTGGVGY